MFAVWSTGDHAHKPLTLRCWIPTSSNQEHPLPKLLKWGATGWESSESVRECVTFWTTVKYSLNIEGITVNVVRVKCDAHFKGKIEWFNDWSSAFYLILRDAFHLYNTSTAVEGKFHFWTQYIKKNHLYSSAVHSQLKERYFHFYIHHVAGLYNALILLLPRTMWNNDISLFLCVEHLVMWFRGSSSRWTHKSVELCLGKL